MREAPVELSDVNEPASIAEALNHASVVRVASGLRLGAARDDEHDRWRIAPHGLILG